MNKICETLSNNLSRAQVRYLKSLLTGNYTANLTTEYLAIFGAHDVLETLLIPIWFHNQDKKLRIDSITSYTITGTNAENSIRSILSYFQNPGHPQIILNCTKRGNSFIDTYMKGHTEWKYLDRLSLYLQLSAHHKVKVFQNRNQTLICSNIENEEYLRRIVSALPLILKDTFTFSEETLNLYKGMLGDLNGAITSEAFAKFLKNTKILEQQKLNELTNAIKGLVSHEYNNLKEEERICNNNIEEYENALLGHLNHLREIQAKISFYKPTTDAEELAKYIIANPNIADYVVCGDVILLAIEAPLEYIEVPAFKKLIQNAGSFIWPKWNNVPSPIAQHSTEFIQMLSDLFLKDRYTIYTRAEIVLDLEKREAYPFYKLSRHRSSRDENRINSAYPENWKINKRLLNNKTITPHMHIEFYDCWSGNKANIAKCLNKNDIIGAIDIAVSTVKDINVTDSTVFNRFIHDGLWAPTTYDTSFYQYNTRPDLQFKTIYDNEQKKFRTFGDIFYNDYVKENITQFDINEDFSDII